MFSKTLTTLLVCLVAFTCALPAESPLRPRDASADPVALPATAGVISGDQVAIINFFNTTSTNANTIAAAKKCQTAASQVKLEESSCYKVPANKLGFKISSVVSGCKIWGYATADCSDLNQQMTAGCFDVSSDTGSGPASLKATC